MLSIRANEYPNVWEFSDECPSPPKNSTWVPANIRVKAFLDIFLLPQFFRKIIIWNRGSEYLGNFKIYGLKKKDKYLLVDWLYEAERLKLYLADSCEGSGHMSVYFVPQSPSEFLSKILAKKHYGKSKSITLGTGKSNDPLGFADMTDLNFLESDLFKNVERMFTFSHDADYLYEIFR